MIIFNKFYKKTHSIDDKRGNCATKVNQQNMINLLNFMLIYLLNLSLQVSFEYYWLLVLT